MTAPYMLTSPAISAATPTSVPAPVPAPHDASGPARFRVRIADDQADVRAAQRLRYRVFADEMGAVLHSPEPGLDIDPLDDYCDHLLVVEEATGTVVGTYRMLPPAAAVRARRTYADSEFDLANLAGLRSDTVEVGRSCIHPDYRDGAVIGLMWGGILRYLLRTGHTWVAGCCSTSLADGGSLAAGVWDRVAAKYLSSEELRVTPYRPWDPTGIARPARTVLPALLRGYLRLGAEVCGPPAHDPEFGVADLYILLSLDRTDPRYLKHFMRLGSA